MLAPAGFRQTGRIGEFEIRPLVRGDLDVLFGPRTRAFGEEWLAAQAKGGVCVAVALLGGRPVGRVTLVFDGYREEAVLRAGVVLPAFRSRRIGSRLAAYAEDVARGRGRTRIVLTVAKVNTRAQQLYERLGYVRCGEKTTTWSYAENGETVDVVEDVWVMQKDL